MPSNTTELTHAQLVGMVVALRKGMHDMVIAHRFGGFDELMQDEIKELLHQTTLEPAPTDLVDGNFDKSWWQGNGRAT